MIFSRRIAVAIAAFFVVSASIFAAETTKSAVDAAPSSPEPLRYRRILVPADRMDEWPARSERYLPIDREEFERLIAPLGGKNAFPTNGRIDSALFHAELRDEKTLVGDAILDMTLTENKPTFISLDPCKLALFETSPDSSKNADSANVASLGVDADGRLIFRAVRSGAWRGVWSSAGRRGSDGAVDFTLDLPKSLRSEILVDLPKTLALRSDAGEISSETKSETSNRWKIELGTSSRARLRIVPIQAKIAVAEIDLDTPTVRESSEYLVSRKGLALKSTWKIRSPESPLKSVTANLDPGSRIIAAKLDGNPIAWRANASAGDDVVIDFPDSIGAEEKVLTLTLAADLRLGESGRLPRVRLRKVFWESGTLSLETTREYELRRARPIDCSQISVSESDARAGETCRYQCFGPDATLETLIAAKKPRMTAFSATTVELGSVEAVAHVAVALQTADVSAFGMDFSLGKGWRVESAETQPSGVLSDWETADGEQGSRVLKLRFSRPTSPNQALRIVVTAKQTLDGAGRSRQLDELLPIRALNVEERRLACIRAAGADEIQLHGGDEKCRIDMQEMSPLEAELFGEQPRGTFFLVDDAIDRPVISLVRRQSVYSADVRAEIGIRNEAVREEFVIRCEPEATSPERVVVQFSQATDSPYQWALGSEGSRAISARRLTSEEAYAAGSMNAAETWEIKLKRVESGPFEIRAIRDCEATDKLPVVLASVPEASKQRGTLTVRRGGLTDYSIVNRRLTPLPPEPTAFPFVPEQLATFRFDPSKDVVGATEPAVRLERKTGIPASSVVILQSHLQTRAAPDGPSRNLLEMDVLNDGFSILRVALPQGCSDEDVLCVWNDGAPTTWSVEPKKNVDDVTTISIPLTAEKRYARVVVRFDAKTARPSFFSTLAAPWPVIEAKTLMRRWTVWLPPGFDAGSDGRKASTDSGNRGDGERSSFGGIGREPGEKPFAFWTTAAWASLVEEPSAPRIAENVRMLMTRARYVLRENGESSKRSSWRDFFDPFAETASPLHVLIDDEEFERLGLTPLSTLPALDPESVGDPVIELLQKSHLVALVGPEAILLTSQSAAASLHRHVASWRHPFVGLLADDGFARSLGAAAKKNVDERYWTVASWIRRPPKILWFQTRHNLPGYESEDMQGWSASSFGAVVGRPMSVTVYHRDAWRVFALGAFASLATLTYWFRANWRLWIYAAAVCCVGSLTLASPTVWPFSAAFAGILCGAIFASLGPRSDGKVIRIDPFDAGLNEKTVDWKTPKAEDAKTVVKKRSGSSVGRGLTELTGLLIVAALLAAQSSYAEETSSIAPSRTTADAPTDELSPIYPALSPIDELKRPVGDKLYLPEKFYRELNARSPLSIDAPRGWSLVAAEYRGSVRRSAYDGALTAEPLRAEFEIVTFVRAAAVSLPLKCLDASRIVTRATLDGSPVNVKRGEAGDTLEFEIAEPGEHRLAVSLPPIMRGDAGFSGWDWRVPKTPQSRLELLLPDDAPKIETPTALGLARIEGAPRRLKVDLGPAGRLVARFSAQPRSDAPFVIDEAMRLSVKPNAAKLDLRLRARNGDFPKRLTFRVDSRLSLNASQIAGAPSVANTPAVDGTRQITLVWAASPTRGTPVTLSFNIADATGVGNLRWPKIELLDYNEGDRFLGVTIDPRLQGESRGERRLRPTAPGEWAAVWGVGDPAPIMSFKLLADPVDWSLAVRLRETEIVARQESLVSIGRREANVEFLSALDSRGGDAFQYDLVTPARLTIDFVSVRQGEKELVSRWAREKDGRVVAFLSEPAVGPHTLRLSGHATIAPPCALLASDIHIEGVRIESAVTRFFTRPGVVAKINVENGTPTDEPSLSTDDVDRGRQIAAFAVKNGEALSGSADVSLNRPELRAEQITTMTAAADDRWTATTEFSLTATEGSVDEMQFDVSDSCEGPFSFSPEAKLVVVDMADGTRRVVVKPNQPLVGLNHLTLRCGLRFKPGERPATPKIDLRDATIVEAWVAVPKRPQNQTAAWLARGLTLAKKPPRWASLPDDGSMIFYETQADDYQATLRLRSVVGEGAIVRFADVRLGWTVDQGALAMAIFEVEPNGANSVRLRSSDSRKIFSVVVDGSPVRLASQADGLSIPLDSERLTQQVVLLYADSIDVSDGETVAFSTPQLGATVSPRTLWTIVSPKGYSPRKALVKDGDFISNAERQAVRFRETAASIESVASGLPEDLEETRRWYRLAFRRYLDARFALQEEFIRAKNENDYQPYLDEISATDGKQSAFAAKSGLEKQWNAMRSEAPFGPDAEDYWRFFVRQSRPAVSFVSREATANTSILYEVDGGSSFWPTFVKVLGVIAVAAIAWGAFRRGFWKQWRRERPYALGVALGLIWWTWLAPSFLGLVIAAAFTAGKIYSARRAKRFRLANSASQTL